MLSRISWMSCRASQVFFKVFFQELQIELSGLGRDIKMKAGFKKARLWYDWQLFYSISQVEICF